MNRRALPRIVRAAALVCAVAPSLSAQKERDTESTGHGITLSAAIQSALNQNVDVLLSIQALDSARADRRGARTWPNPSVGGVPNTPYQYSASIPLDVMPQRFFRIAAADAGADAADLDTHDVRRQITLAVTRQFYAGLLAESRLRNARERRDMVAQVLQADSARFRAGDVAERSIGRSEIELARADADVSRAVTDVQETRIALQGVMGILHPDSTLAAIGSLEYKRLELSGDSLMATARSHRPDLEAAQDRVAQSEHQKRTAVALLLPTPEVSYVRQRTGPFEDGHYYSLGLSFEIPLLNLFGAERERAAAALESARLAQRRAQAQVDRDVMVALAEFRVQRELVERYQSGPVAKSAKGVEAVRYAYARGAASLLEVLDAVRTEQDVRNEYVAALHDYWVSVYSLNAAVGVDVFGVSRESR